MRWDVRSIAIVALLSICLPPQVRAQGAKDSLPASERVFDLKPGQFIWEPEAVPAGPLVILVNTAEQFAVVYRNGVRIGASSVSTGRPGFATPTGVFTILQKDANHHSSIYNNALMPYTERLTWSGIALHAGGLPGYPSSHGCIHLPLTFAKALFGVTTMGITVIITDKPVRPATSRGSAFLAAQNASQALPASPESNREFAWQPQLSPAGPLSLVISGADGRLVAIRNGIEIGWAQLKLRGEGPLGTQALVLMRDEDTQAPENAFTKAGFSWHRISLPSASNENSSGPSNLDRISVPNAFLLLLMPAIEPGTTVVTTDLSLSAAGSNSPLTVIASR